MSLLVGSMCTGYGGLDAGVMAVLGNAELAWVADNDPGISVFLGHRMPDVPNFGDIRAAHWETIPPADVICAGFPCQPVSAAGKQKGTADERWLWPYITGAVSRMAARPRLLVFENVPRLLTIDGGAVISQIIGSLAEMGYVGCYGIFSAADAGAAHLRRRWFCAAADAQGVGWPSWRPAADRDRHSPGDHEDVPDTESRARRTGERGRRLAPIGGQEISQCGHSSEQAVPDPDRGLREGRPDQQVRGQERRAAAGRGSEGAFPDPGSQGLQRHLAARYGHEKARQREIADGTAGGPAVGGGALNWQEYEPAVRRWELISGYPVPYPVEPGRNGKSRMTAAFPEWLMGLPPGWVTGVPGLSRSAQIRAVGNGVVPQQAAMAVSWLLDILRENTG